MPAPAPLGIAGRAIGLLTERASAPYVGDAASTLSAMLAERRRVADEGARSLMASASAEDGGAPDQSSGQSPGQPSGGDEPSSGGGEDGDEPDYYGFQISPQPAKPDVVPTEPSGEPFDVKEETAGQLTLLYFGYTNCPDICGTVLGNLSSALTRLEEDDR